MNSTEEINMSAPPGFTPVRSQVRLEQLCEYLSSNLGKELGVLEPGSAEIWQANNGMSNPTYLLYSAERPQKKIIIRRKPSGMTGHFILFYL